MLLEPYDFAPLPGSVAVVIEYIPLPHSRRRTLRSSTYNAWYLLLFECTVGLRSISISVWPSEFYDRGPRPGKGEYGFHYS